MNNLLFLSILIWVMQAQAEIKRSHIQSRQETIKFWQEIIEALKERGIEKNSTYIKRAEVRLKNAQRKFKYLVKEIEIKL